MEKTKLEYFLFRLIRDGLRAGEIANFIIDAETYSDKSVIFDNKSTELIFSLAKEFARRLM
jgi:hypothetical protein